MFGGLSKNAKAMLTFLIWINFGFIFSFNQISFLLEENMLLLKVNQKLQINYSLVPGKQSLVTPTTISFQYPVVAFEILPLLHVLVTRNLFAWQCFFPMQYEWNIFKIWKNCPSQEESKKIQQINVLWYPGWDSGKEKGYQGKTREM